MLSVTLKGPKKECNPSSEMKVDLSRKSTYQDDSCFVAHRQRKMALS